MPLMSVRELDKCPVSLDKTDGPADIRRFEFVSDGTGGYPPVRIEVCTLGASITRWRVLSRNSSAYDDIVLGFESVQDMLQSGNPAYFGVTVGRVANRIARGRLQVEKNGPVYQLDVNNPPNHLHGGKYPFSHRNWEAQVVSDGASNGAPRVRFHHVSADGDQHYPGSVQVFADYTAKKEHDGSIELNIEYRAELLGCDDAIATPINLANHSYFNLNCHDDPRGILDHTLRLNCAAYTPVDDTNIPTRQIVPVAQDAVMNVNEARTVGDVLQTFGIDKAGLTADQASRNVRVCTGLSPDLALSSAISDPSNSPYGLDHNFVVNAAQDAPLATVATLAHAASGRKLTVRARTPGVQVYTANFLDGTTPAPNACRHGVAYRQWQAICLETQHFPDSVHVDANLHPEFAAGKCVVLDAAHRTYHHHLQYQLDYGVDAGKQAPTGTSKRIMIDFSGTDTDGTTYESVAHMWKAQGVRSADTDANGGADEPYAEWYFRAAAYYENHCDATNDGVLGGFGHLSNVDLAFSRTFLEEMIRQDRWTGFIGPLATACECGAGIGRVTRGLLLPMGAQRCDLVESSPRLLTAAPDYLGDDYAAKCRFFCHGLQRWKPPRKAYALIWIQWVLIYLTDDDAIDFLRRCAESLIDRNSLIVLKENVCDTQDGHDFIVDLDDASVTRSVDYWTALIEMAGLQVVSHQVQQDWPEAELFNVAMFALRP